MEPLSPKENSQLFGHEQTEKHILSLLQSGRMPQSILLTGSKGIGKATFAYHLARHILTGSTATADASMPGLFGDVQPTLASDRFACTPESPVFRKVMQGSHPDLLVVEPSFDERKKEYRSDILVDEVRKVNDFLSLTPAEGNMRIVIIDSADAMNTNAANSLLKILEEPPAGALILLISHNPGKLLATIRSRCLAIKMHPLGYETFAAILRAQAVDATPEQLRQLALLSYFSPGEALTLNEASVIDIYDDFLATLQKAPQLDSSKLQQFLTNHGTKDWETTRHVLLWFIAKLGLYAANPAGLEECIAGEGAVMSRLLSAKPLDYWLDMWEKTSALCNDTERLNLDPKQALLSIFHGLEGTALL